MRSSFLSLSNLSSADVGAWDELARHAIEPNPFLHPDFVRAAAAHLDTSDVELLVVTDGPQWAACLPVVRTRRWREIPVPAVVGWLHEYAFLGTPLVADPPGPALGALVDRARRDRRAALLALPWMVENGPVGYALAAELRERDVAPVSYTQFERAFVTRRATPTYLDGRLSTRRRKEARRLRRGLEAELGCQLEVADRAGEPAAVAAFLRIEASGWKARAGTAMAAQVGHGALFVDVCATFAAAGRLELLTLGPLERPVAMQANLLAGDGLFCFKVAYDEEYARFSPGVQLELAALEVFHEREEIAWMDSCAAPDAELINKLWPERRTLETVLIPSSSVLGRVARPRVVRAAQHARRLGARARDTALVRSLF